MELCDSSTSPRNNDGRLNVLFSIRKNIFNKEALFVIGQLNKRHVYTVKRGSCKH